MRWQWYQVIQKFIHQLVCQQMFTELDTEDTEIESSWREEKGGLHAKSQWTAQSKVAEEQTGLAEGGANHLLAADTVQWYL